MQLAAMPAGNFLEGPDLAHHFEQHLREAWAMTTALRNQAS